MHGIGMIAPFGLADATRMLIRIGGGLACVGSIWLTFFAPDWYRRLIERHATASPDDQSSQAPESAA
jgi:hypothetical protein